MNIKSFFEETTSDLRNAVNRFPYSMALLVLSILVASYFIELKDDDNVLIKLLFSAGIAILMTVVVKLLHENYSINSVFIHAGSVLSIITGVLIFVLMPEDIYESYNFWIPLFFGSVVALLLLFLSVAPFIVNRKGFLSFNKDLFTSYWASFLVSVLVFGGFSLLLLALENLFNVVIGSTLYAHLALWSFGLLGVGRFLSEIPQSEFRDKEEGVNKFLRFIITYIGIPITLVYGIVAYVYLIKSLLFDDETIEWINPFMMWFFGIGFNTYFLNKLVISSKSINNAFEKLWLWFVLPLLIYFTLNLFYLISSQYLDIDYYYLIMTGLLLLISVVYLLIKKNEDLRIINFAGIGLCLFSILPTPFNAWNAPLNYQKDMLVDFFSENGLIVNEQFVIPDTPIKLDDLSQEILTNLDAKDALSFLNNFDGNDILSEKVELSEFYENKMIYDEYGARNTIDYINYSFTPTTHNLNAYDKLIPVISYNNREIKNKVMLENGKPVLVLDDFRYDLSPSPNDFERGRYEEKLSETLSVALIFHYVYGEKRSSGYYLSDMQGICFVKQGG